jgi:S-(hydroxymethyl)glutathione dehydrogenase / alcohol dehydrogenase
MKALILHELNKISVEDVELDPPKAHEIKIKVAAAGVCHSDLSAINGTLPSQFPIALGHEGSGVVEAVGEGVTRTKPGDHVIMSFVPNCGRCFHCARNEAFLCRALTKGGTLDGTSRIHWNGKSVSPFCGLGNMAEYVVCPEISVVPIPKEIPLNVAALIGCAVTTGVGAAINTARIEVGSTVAVFGCGGVGLSVLQGARLAGASRIFAIDLSDEKLELARRFGATDCLRGDTSVAKAIQAATSGLGVDYAFEAIGNPSVAEIAMQATRRGGTTVIVGVGKLTDSIKVNALTFPLSGKTLCGCMYGSANPQYDFPRMLELYRRGQLDLEGMVTRTYTLAEAPRAFADLEKGVNARGVISFA